MESAEEFLSSLSPQERGRVIAILRVAHGMTIDALAKVARVSANTVADWEHGKVASSHNLFARLNSVLNLSLGRLQHGFALVHAQGGKPSSRGYLDRETEIDSYSKLDITDSTAREIETEIARLYAEIGRLETQIRLLQMELAVRHGILRSRG